MFVNNSKIHRYLAMPLLAVTLLFTSVSPTEAASLSTQWIYVGNGGKAYSYAETTDSQRRLGVRAWVEGQCCSAQLVAGHIQLYVENLGEWFGHGWQYATVREWGGSEFAIFPSAWTGLPNGSYFVRVHYAWLTTSGWIVRTQDVGWFTFR